MVAKSDPNSKLIAENRRARFDYSIESDLEAGIMLLGSEVKSLRQGGSNIAESYASVEGGELWLINGYIAPYLQAKTFGHDERRRRKLLVSKKELSRLWSAVGREGMTIVPMKMYFNDKGIVKLKLGIAKGKKLADKRETSGQARLGTRQGPADEAEQPGLTCPCVRHLLPDIPTYGMVSATGHQVRGKRWLVLRGEAVIEGRW
jgi:SsrA-binding protein